MFLTSGYALMIQVLAKAGVRPQSDFQKFKLAYSGRIFAGRSSENTTATLPKVKGFFFIAHASPGDSCPRKVKANVPQLQYSRLPFL